MIEPSGLSSHSSEKNTSATSPVSPRTVSLARLKYDQRAYDALNLKGLFIPACPAHTISSLAFADAALMAHEMVTTKANHGNIHVSDTS